MNQNLYQDTLWKSDYNLSSMKSFRTRRWESSDQLPNNLTKTFWQLRSNVKYLSFLECKKMELFFFGLPEIEMQYLFDAPGVLDDKLFIDLLRANRFLQTNNVLSQEVLLQRLRVLQAIESRPIWSKNLLYTFKGNLKYEIQHIRVAIRKVKKFSGWVRNSSAVGSKSKSKILGYDPEIFGVVLDEDNDYFRYLTTPVLDSSFPGILGITIEEIDPQLLKSLLILKMSSF